MNEKIFLDIVFKELYKKYANADFGRYKKKSDGRMERDIVVRFLIVNDLYDKKTKMIQEESFLLRYLNDTFTSWSAWGDRSRANVICFVFNDTRYQKYRAKARTEVAGRSSYWEDL